MRTVQLVSLEALDLSQTKHVLHSQEVEMFLGQVEVSQDHEEMEYLGSVKLSEVERVQQQIVDVVRRLEDAGEINLHAKDENEEYIK